MSCAAGKFQPESKGTSCVNVSAGHYSLSHSSVQLECSPGRFSELPGQRSCELCPAAKFQSSSGQTACEECPTGSYCSAGASAPTLCMAGSYRNTTGGAVASDCSTCEVGSACPSGATHPAPCPSGKYGDTSGQTACSSCPSGKFQSSSGQTSCEACPEGSYCSEMASAPTSCPAGRYRNATGGTMVAECSVCPPGSACLAGAISPTACRPGTYTNAAEMDACLACPVGKQQPQSNATACLACASGSYCMEGASAPLPCHTGTYSDSTDLGSASECTDCTEGFFCPLGSANAIACSAGFFVDSPRKGQCEACPMGTFQNETGASTCRRCRSGSFCPKGATMELPANCLPGTYGNMSDADGEPECLICPVGQACAGGAASPRDCGAGSFSNAPGADQCTPCKGGEVQDSAGKTACSECPTGSYCPPGSAAAIKCDEGTFRSSRGAAAAEECTDCPLGRFCVPGADQPRLCGVATEAPSKRMGLCTSCVEGKFEDRQGSSACKTCPLGYYCPSSSATPIPATCDPGSYVEGNFTDRSDCKACPPGSACAGGQSQPSTCLPGTVSPAQGSLQCLKCAPGSFQGSEGQTACEQCTKGYYCIEGAATPVPCPGGTSSNALGVSTKADCTPVLAGFWAPLGSELPEPCPTTGFYCPGAAADELYGGSKPVLVPVGSSTSMEEVEIVQMDVTLDLTCADFDLDKVKAALAAQYKVDVALISLDNPCASRRRVRELRPAARALSALTLTITIATAATKADGTTVSAPPVADLLDSVASIDDSTLASSLGTALGTAVTVTSGPPKQATVQRVVRTTCPRGFWCTAGLTVACETGFYNPTTNANNQSACIKCPEHAVTLGSNATSLDQCLCDWQYYNADHLSRGVRCLRCPIGSSCTNPGVTLEALPVKVGFFRKSRSTVDVRSCADVAVGCVPGESECPESHSGCAGGHDPATQCRPGLSGVFCSVCSNVSQAHFYVAASETSPATCRPCEDFALAMVVGAVCAIGFVVFLVAGICVWRKCVPPKWKKEIRRVWALYGFDTKLKSLISFYQIACKVAVVYQVTLPPAVVALLSAFEVAISFGLDLTAPFECLGARSYLQRLQFWIFAPLGLSLFLVIVGICYKRVSQRGSVTKEGSLRGGVTWALPLVFKLMFVLYSTINLRAFEAFRCHDFGEVDGRWLMADVEVRCDSEEHGMIQTWAWLAIVLYPIGWTALTAVLLFAVRKSISKVRPPTPLSEALRFVYADYELWCYWWEVLEMARRFLLVGLMSIVLKGTIVQLVIAALFCIFYLVLQLQAKPFVRAADDYVALASTTSLAVLFFLCVVLKVGVLTDTPEVDAILPPRLRANFAVPSALLTVGMLGSVIACLVLSFVISLQQAKDERQRQLLEAREAKAKRLIHETTGRPVVPPLLASQASRTSRGTVGESKSKRAAYHIFLSHVWSTAQDQMRIVRTRLLEMMPELSVFLDVEDLEDISDLEGYIERSSVILVMCTKGYFQSRNCMIELRSAVRMGKPMFAMLDLDSDTRSLTKDEVGAELLAADASYAKWGFEEDGGPDGAACFEALFAQEPIEWNRLGVFQTVTMRLAAERTLPKEYHGCTYIAGESTRKPVALGPPRHGCTCHMYSSLSNPRADEFAAEVAEWLTKRPEKSLAPLQVTSDLAMLHRCTAMLLYLNGLTWTSSTRNALAHEIARAMSLGIPILLAHEMPGLGREEERHGIAFGSFFDSSATPIELIKAGIYANIAVPLKGGPWRDTSMVEVVKAIANVPERGEPKEVKVADVTFVQKADTAQPQQNKPPNQPQRRRLSLKNLVVTVAQTSRLCSTRTPEANQPPSADEHLAIGGPAAAGRQARPPPHSLATSKFKCSMRRLSLTTGHPLPRRAGGGRTARTHDESSGLGGSTTRRVLARAHDRRHESGDGEVTRRDRRSHLDDEAGDGSEGALEPPPSFRAAARAERHIRFKGARRVPQGATAVAQTAMSGRPANAALPTPGCLPAPKEATASGHTRRPVAAAPVANADEAEDDAEADVFLAMPKETVERITRRTMCAPVCALPSAIPRAELAPASLEDNFFGDDPLRLEPGFDSELSDEQQTSSRQASSRRTGDVVLGSETRSSKIRI